MGGKRTEACGRCSVSTVVEAAGDEEGAGSGANPFDGERIEVEESTLRSVVRHEVAVAGLRRRLDEWATRFTFGR
ncbi:MAG: hypothetical protein V5A46_03715 [Haloferacaceae archaeon]